jgi:hypothetical protein
MLRSTVFFKTENTVHKTLNGYFIISFPFTSRPSLFSLTFLTKQYTPIYLVQFSTHQARLSVSCSPTLNWEQNRGCHRQAVFSC